MSITAGRLQASQVQWVADILMGAAYADGTLEGAEREAVHRVVRELLDGAELSEELRERIERFDPAKFDLQAACDELKVQGAEERRALLNLVSSITESDESHDLEESAYLRKVGTCLGAAAEEYSDLTVEIISVSGVRRAPPPLPKKK
jgi:uncharacterized tellurite resistance protein B-like protein